MRWRRILVGMTAGVAVLLALAAAASAYGDHGRIRHVVVIYQENHSFDNVFGRFCVRTGRCDGTKMGKLRGGEPIKLRKSPDRVPDAGHTGGAQTEAINGGLMDGWIGINGCSKARDYGCLTQFSPKQIPNLTQLARHFAISDRTFQMDSVSSWGAHLELVAATLDGFTGDRIPETSTGMTGHLGTGCDARVDADWRPYPGAPISKQPSCVPDYRLDPEEHPFGGAYRRTRVEHVPTIM